MSKRLFSDECNHNFYDENGYVVIPDFLSLSQIQQLSDIYHKNEYNAKVKGFHRTLDLIDINQKRTVSESINKIVTPISKNVLIDYRFLLTSFMTKEKGATDFDIHQNWTFVDESMFTSLVIWIPLQDVDENNGTMYFIPKSDKWEKSIRGNNIKWKYEHEKTTLQSRLIPVFLKAGDAVIFDDATIHYTSANKTDKPRISIAQVMIPNAAQPVFYNFNESTNLIEQYAIDKNFYLEFTNRYLNNKGFKDVELLKTFDLIW